MSLHDLKKQILWLMPGLFVKRWLGLVAIGFVMLILGVSLSFGLQPVTTFISLLKVLALQIPSHFSGPVLMFVGTFILLLGARKIYGSLSSAIVVEGTETNILDALYKRRKLTQGPKIVAIGGGTGLSTLLRGIKNYTSNITAVVTVGDDGGSSGRLREEHGVIPPGDIRNCIAALADEEGLITELFQYRFTSGHGLEGHSFGNLFLTAMCQVTGDMLSAVKESSKVLNIRGKVLPSTLDNITLVAEMEDGNMVVGESHIPEARGRIKQLRCLPESPKPLPDVLKAIKEAELIILGPGSLYTSVIPNLLIDEIAREVSLSKAPKVYIANIMTQPGETDGFSVGDHVRVIQQHAHYDGIIDVALVNQSISPQLLEKYLEAGYKKVDLDQDICDGLGIVVQQGLMMDADNHQHIRHNPDKLAKLIIDWYKDHAPAIRKTEQAAEKLSIQQSRELAESTKNK